MIPDIVHDAVALSIIFSCFYFHWLVIIPALALSILVDYYKTKTTIKNMSKDW